MKIAIEYQGLRVPDYALSYLVNGDSSGISDADRLAIDQWYEQFHNEARELVSSGNAHSAQVVFSAGDEEPYFTRSPEFGLACNVVESSVVILIPDKPVKPLIVAIEFSNRRVSTIELEGSEIKVVGVIPHGSSFHPLTSEGRDCLVEFLNSIKYRPSDVDAGEEATRPPYNC